MKDQYFGDINYFRKYGLLRALQFSSECRLLVAWMLTPDDNGRDGRFRSYLQRPEEWKHFDPELFASITAALCSASTPRVSLLERAGVLPRSRFYSAMVPDGRIERDLWRSGLMESARGMDLVFVDPDNGIEVPSRPVGRRGSSKYVTWKELQELWDFGCSLLIYQHFRREPRQNFAERLVSELRGRMGTPFTHAFRTAHVLFLLVAQGEHEASFRNAVSSSLRRWEGQIENLGVSGKPLEPAGFGSG